MGGTYTPENVVLLTVPEHAEAHHQLFLHYGRTADFVAWKTLSGQMGKEEAFLTILKSPERRAKISAAHIGIRPTVESRNKMRKSQLGNSNALGHQYQHTPEARAKISAAMKGKKHSLGHKDSPETRAKKSAALIGNRYGVGNHNARGRRTPTPEQRAAAKRGRAKELQ